MLCEVVIDSEIYHPRDQGIIKQGKVWLTFRMARPLASEVVIGLEKNILARVSFIHMIVHLRVNAKHF